MSEASDRVDRLVHELRRALFAYPSNTLEGRALRAQRTVEEQERVELRIAEEVAVEARIRDEMVAEAKAEVESR